MDQLVVNLIHATGTLSGSSGALLLLRVHGTIGLVLVKRRARPVGCRAVVSLGSRQKSPMLCITHLYLGFCLGGDHVFQMV